MANDVTVNINAETNVPEAADKSKKAMSQMETAMEGMNKKMASFGKDLILSYVAPMVLLNKAFDYVSQKMEEQRQLVKDSIEFAKKGESKELDPAFVSLARKQAAKEQEAKDKEMAGISREETTKKFLENASDADMERFYKRLGAGSKIYTFGDSAENLSKRKEVQNAVRDIENANLLRAEEEARKAKGPGIDNVGVQNPVFGVGTVSPIVTALDKQMEEQQKQTILLERIASNAPQKVEQQDYTKQPNRPTPYGL